MTLALLGAGLAPASWKPREIGTLQDSGRNLVDIERMERGYYEEILDAGRRLDALGAAALAARKGRGEGPEVFHSGALDQSVDDLREFVLRPDIHESLKGQSWTTNALGMRDREYPREKPPGTVRIALMGDSIAAGWGVSDGEPFESLVEDELNQRPDGPAVEIWNFAVPGHAPGQRWEHFQRLGWPCQPDVVIYEATPADVGWDEHRLRGLLPRGLGWDAPQYRRALKQSGARPGDTFEVYKYLLARDDWAILGNVYQEIVAGCRSHDVPVLFVLIPRVGSAADKADRARLVSLARKTGFSRILDLSDCYGGLDPSDLAIAPDDYHPNALGHSLLAGRLLPSVAEEVDRIASTNSGLPTATPGPDEESRKGVGP
jgi:lysophospholipase L1-like esterase